jgi:hypothetical protein
MCSHFAHELLEAIAVARCGPRLAEADGEFVNSLMRRVCRRQ